MPQMGYDMQQGTLVRWLKQEGEAVQRGETIAEIETDKAVVEMQAYASGVLRLIVVSDGATVPVGQLIAVIGTAEEEIPQEWLEATPAPQPEAVAPTEAPAPTEAQAPQSEPLPGEAPPTRERVRASPLARRLAQEHGIDLSQIQGSGPNGRVVEEDVHAYLEQPRQVGATPAPVAPAREGAPPRGEAAEPQLVELSRMRQAIARLTTRAKQEAPHFYVTTEVHMDMAMAIRQQLNQELEGQNLRVSVNDLVIKACVLALQKHPTFNASYQDGKLQHHPRVNIGIAVALEAGLIVPVLADCNDKSIQEIAKAARELIQRTQEGRLSEAEYTGGTFSISNMGIYDVDSFTAIIFPPQAAVLAVGTVKKQAVVVNDEVRVAQVMKVTLSVDHRVADGAQAAQFLMEIKRVLEQPVALLV